MKTMMPSWRWARRALASCRWSQADWCALRRPLPPPPAHRLRVTFALGSLQVIAYNSALTDMTGFGGLTKAGDLTIRNNAVLSVLSFPRLTDVSEDLILEGNGVEPSRARLSL